jgi:hypothetical protein
MTCRQNNLNTLFYRLVFYFFPGPLQFRERAATPIHSRRAAEVSTKSSLLGQETDRIVENFRTKVNSHLTEFEISGEKCQNRNKRTHKIAVILL